MVIILILSPEASSNLISKRENAHGRRAKKTLKSFSARCNKCTTVMKRWLVLLFGRRDFYSRNTRRSPIQENHADTLQSKLEHLVQAERDRQRQIRDLEGKIQRMEAEYNQPLPDEVVVVLEDKNGAIKRQKVSALNLLIEFPDRMF